MKYLEGNDEFLAQYTKFLSRRLINHDSFAEHFELEMINKLKV